MKEHKARKRFGQNFLQDTRIIADIVNAVRPQADDVHQRRKTIRNNLKELAGDEDLQAVGISPQDRAEHIAPEKYVELSNYLVRKVV